MRSRKRIAQQAVNPLPRGEHLRTFEFMRQPALCIENFAGCDLNAKVLCSEAEPTQPFDQFPLGDYPGAPAGQLALHTLVDIDVPAGAPQQKPGEQSAHRTADNQCALSVSPGQEISLDLFVYLFILYMTASSFGGIPMALTMLDKQAEKKDESQWQADIAAEFERESKNPNPCVGTTLLSENERTRVSIIRLAPGECIRFHRHVLDSFWTSVSGGRGRQHVPEGTTVEYTYQPGKPRHESYGKGEFKVHDLENLGDREMVFMTVEFLNRAHKALPRPEHVRPAAAA